MPSSHDHTDDGTELAQDDNITTEWTFVEQAHYARESHRDLTTEIMFAIAAADDTDPRNIKDPPLYECIDVAAIEDAFFGPEVAGDERDGEGTVSFRYHQYRVEVADDGWITVVRFTGDEETP